MPKMRKSVLYSLALLAVGAFCLWQYQFSGTHAVQPKVAFLSIGQGDSIFIQAGNGSQMIIDGGPKGSLIKTLKPEMPEGDTSIDVIMVTNPDADHYAGFLELLDMYSVGAVIESGVVSKTKTYQQFEAMIQKKHIPRLIARRGMEVRFDTEPSVRFDVLFPDRPTAGLTNNDASLVGKLHFGRSTIMFTGDATVKTESFLLSANPVESLRSDILKVGHHGSHTSTSSPFLRAVSPAFAVISAGKNNRYGHPHQEIVNRLQENGAQVLVTKDLGTIVLHFDGEKLYFDG